VRVSRVRFSVRVRDGGGKLPLLLASALLTALHAQDRRFYHVSDEILNHYDCALRTGMKAR
jgi:hypothetical protein